MIQNKYWRKLIGADQKIPTEQKIFNSVCIFAFLAIFLSIVFNFSVGLNNLAYYQFAFILVLSIIFYQSRVKGRFRFGFFVFGICNYAFLSVNYFYNMGLNGPTFLASFISLYFLISISSLKMAPWWVLGHLALAVLLSTIQYKFPNTVVYNYKSELGHFVDINFTFFIIVIFTYMIAVSIKGRYFQERDKVTQQNSIIEEKNARLEYIDRERSRLFSIISHDLRSPLTSINGYLELLNSDDLNEEEKTQAQNELLNLSNYTSEMLNNLLRWSKNQLEGNQLYLQNINLAETLNNSVNVCRILCEKKGIGFTAAIPLHLSVYADKDHIDLVVRNLLSNSVKFTKPKGNIHIAAEEQNQQCIITISDDGTGIDETQKKLVFSSEIKPTFGTHNEKGIGLGLVMCKEFVEKQGGDIHFESEYGKGTTFFVSLKSA